MRLYRLLEDLDEVGLYFRHRVYLKCLVFYYYIFTVEVVPVSYYFGVDLGDNVSVVARLGAFVVSPWAAMAVSAVPRPLPELPVDVAGRVGRVVSVSGTPVGLIVPASRIVSDSASLALASIISIVPASSVASWLE